VRKRHGTFVPLLLLLVVFASWGAAAGAASPQPFGAARKQAKAHARPPVASHHRLSVKGEALVEFRSEVRAAQRGRVTAALGARIVRRLPASAEAPGTTLVLVRSASLSTAQLVKRLSADPAVVAAQPNCWRRVTGAPDDPGFASQWGLLRVGAGDAWPITTGAADVVVADVDTGVDVTHPDLAANIWRNAGEVPGNGIDDDGNGYVDDVYGIDTADHDSVPMDDYGHGTHTSGIMAAVAGNSIGVAGIAPGVKVMALKFIDAMGWGTDAGAIECIDYVIHQKQAGVNVVAISASWGGIPADLFLRNAIKRAGEAGIVFCAAAGNDGSNNDESAFYPASFDCPTIISVAASEPDDALTYFSNYGDCSVDIAAPGTDILSTLPEGDYASWAGTSMATPFVTGTVALCASKYPAETAQQRVDRILAAARPVEALTGKVMTGGVLDVPAALGLGDPTADHAAPVTTALDAAAAATDIRTAVHLFATDGAGGSGVARTEYRLDGGEWTAGDLVRVAVPRHKRIVHTIEYRSVDRAGNTEDAKIAQVTTDTTAPPDHWPGRALTASPLVGGVGAGDFADYYRVRLRRGDSVRMSLDGFGSDVVIQLIGPRGGIGFIAPDFGTRRQFASRVARTGRYVLAVYALSNAAPYTISYAIAPREVDIVPPALSIHGPRREWHRKPVGITVTAKDDRGGSGVSYTELSLDEGLTWQQEGGLLLDAPPDHSGDGLHHVLARAVDKSGNVSNAHGRWVGIDTQGPVTSAWVRSASSNGRRVRIGFKVSDLSLGIWSQLVVRSAAGKVVYQRRLGWFMSVDQVWWAEDVHYTWRLALPHLAAGTYQVLIAGKTHDEAGNRWASATCTEPLVIK
jgi:subtilisin family serine protease